MSINREEEGRSGPTKADGGLYRVDARGAGGVLIGDRGTQINYFYNGTWTDGVAPPPLVSPHGAVDSPYRGLSAFEERDADLFFGRDSATGRVLELLSRCLEGPGLLVVSGVSGAGKSSLVRAGVLPRFRRAGLRSAPEAASWPCLVFTPTSRPLDELAARVAPLTGTDAAAVRNGLAADPAGFALTARAASLAARGHLTQATSTPEQAGQRRMVIVVDQCEQLFTQCADKEQRAFIAALYAAATTKHGDQQVPAAMAVLVIRADFEARLADYAELAPAVQDRYLLTSMTSRQLRMAITQPAAAVGSSVDDDLVQELLDEVRTRVSGSPSAGPAGGVGAGILPLLSHALDQAWRSRSDHVLTLADYERVGGIEGAVASSAERAYGRLTPQQQTTARQVFTRLTAASSDGADTAARAARTDLTAGKDDAQASDVEIVLETFAAERLLTLAAGTVEISHEVLLTAWPLLRDTWLAETHADRSVRTRVQATAEEWIRASRDAAYLYGGSRLATALEAAYRIDTDPRHTPLSQTERDFLRASERADRRRVRRGRTFSAILVVLVVGLAAVAVAAVRANQATASQLASAVSDQLASESLALGDTNATISQLESIAAWGIHPSAQARYAMLVAAARPQFATLTVDSDGVGLVAFGPDGRILITNGPGGTLQLWNLATLRPIGSPLGFTKGSSAVAFSPDGKTLAVGSTDGTVRLWDVATRRQIGGPLGRPTRIAVQSMAFSSRGKMLAVVWNGTVQVWNVATHRQIGSPLNPGVGAALITAVFSPNGKLLATGGADGAARLWDVATGRQVGDPLNHDPSGAVLSLAFNPRGTTLATGGTGGHAGALRLWDVATGQQIGRPLANGTIGPVASLAFSPDGTTLATGGLDGTARLWDVATGRQIGNALNSDISSAVHAVAFSPDGNTLATGSTDGTVRLWNVVVGRQIGRSTIGATAAIFSVAFNPSGNILAAGGFTGPFASAGVVRLWDVATRRQLGHPINSATGIGSVAFSPDGKTLAFCCSDGGVQLWDIATHRQLGPTLDGGGPVTFSPNGKLLATGGVGMGAVRLWDVATRRQIGHLLIGDTAGPVVSVAFSPDGTILATGESVGGNVVRLWDVANHQQIGHPLTSGAVDSLSFSPDGTILATGGHYDGAVRLWDVSTHQLIGAPLTSGISGTVAIDSVAFSPDGTALAVGSADGAVLVWDVATHQLIGNPLIAGNYTVWSVAFSPDGSTLAIGTGSGTIQYWNVGYLANTLRQLCSQVGGSLTRAEWAQYVPPGPAYRRVCP